MSCIGCEYVRILKSQIQGMAHTIREQTGQKCDLAYLIRCRDEQIQELKANCILLDAALEDLSVTLSAREIELERQQETIQAMRGDRLTGTLTLICGVPALRVKDEYWVDFKGFCDLLDIAWEAVGDVHVIFYNKIPIVYKEELN